MRLTPTHAPTHGHALNYFGADYATCVGVLLAARAPLSDKSRTPLEGTLTFTCADHDCSCSVPVERANRGLSVGEILMVLTSNITIGGRNWELPSPPLDIGTPLKFPTDDDFTLGTSAGAIWSNKTFQLDLPGHATTTRTGEYGSPFPRFANDHTAVDEVAVVATGRCISLKAYSWGFSSLLLFTFCCATIFFAAILLTLEFDIYWHGRSTACESHSIYKDVLFLADELRARFGDNVASFSRQALDDKVAKDKKGIGFELAEQPLSRRQIHRLATATDRWEQQLAAEAELSEATQFTRLLTAARNARVKDDGGRAMAEFEDYLRYKEQRAVE
jgi:hypothetical protein